MDVNKSNVARAEEIKCLANEAFSANKYVQAIDLYTQSIELNHHNAVYWANRAFAHIKLEEYGRALEDASRAIDVNPGYSKGYYRRGVAYLAMGKFQEALKDFQQVKKICPKDPDTIKKLKECEKAIIKLKFEEAIGAPDSERNSVAHSIDLQTTGGGSRQSWLLTQMAIVAAAITGIAIATRSREAATLVAATAAVLLITLGTRRWGGGGDGMNSRTLGLLRNSKISEFKKPDVKIDELTFC